MATMEITTMARTTVKITTMERTTVKITLQINKKGENI
jgi:hypothetical protein